MEVLNYIKAQRNKMKLLKELDTAECSIVNFINELDKKKKEFILDAVISDELADGYFKYLISDDTDISKDLDNIDVNNMQSYSDVESILKIAFVCSKFKNWMHDVKAERLLSRLFEIEEYADILVYFFKQITNGAAILQFKQEVLSRVPSFDIAADSDFLDILEQMITIDIRKYQAKLRLIDCNYGVDKKWDLIAHFMYRYTIICNMAEEDLILSNTDNIKALLRDTNNASISTEKIIIGIIEKYQPVHSTWY